MNNSTENDSLYKAAGVDIDFAQSLMAKLKTKISAAKRPEMVAPVGGFGGLFQLDLSRYKNPVLVSSIDGVGTKLIIASLMNKFDTVGYDIVNHCVNDIAVQGAEPLYFLDYIGMGKLRSPLYEEVVGGIADACRKLDCALLGGETAEMPGMYGNDFDVVGVITGVVDKEKLITGQGIKAGHVAVGLASNGLHTNGYSLARHILFEKVRYSLDMELKILGGETLGEALLKPHVCYWPMIKEAFKQKIKIDGMAHITGGGLYDNVPRILPDNLDVRFKKHVLPVPPIFTLIVEDGGVSETEAYRAFNMGIGMVWFLKPEFAEDAIALCEKLDVKAAVCGEVTEGTGKVMVDC